MSYRAFILIAKDVDKVKVFKVKVPFSRDLTLRLVRVIRMRWMATSASTGALPVSLNAYRCKERITHVKKYIYFLQKRATKLCFKCVVMAQNSVLWIRICHSLSYVIASFYPHSHWCWSNERMYCSLFWLFSIQAPEMKRAMKEFQQLQHPLIDPAVSMANLKC